MSARLIAAAPAGFHRYILLVRALCWVRARGIAALWVCFPGPQPFSAFFTRFCTLFINGPFSHDLRGYDSRHDIVGALSYSRLFGCERLARAYSTGWPFSALITPWAPVPSAAWQPRCRFARCISDDDHDFRQSRHEFCAYVTSDQLGGGSIRPAQTGSNLYSQKSK